jgi:hypothetical protein
VVITLRLKYYLEFSRIKKSIKYYDFKTHIMYFPNWTEHLFVIAAEYEYETATEPDLLRLDPKYEMIRNF